MEKLNDLKALLQHEVEDLISVEDQIIEAMPSMIEMAQNAELKKALQQHLSITEKQRTRLDEVQKLVKGEATEESNGENKGLFSGLFDALRGGGEKCKGMEGILAESQKIMKADMDAEVKDAAIIACAQKIEHYEICGYGTARAYAMQLNIKEAENLLQQTLGEEYEADDRLTQLAYAGINEKAETSDEAGGAGNEEARDNKGPKKVAAKKKEQPKKVAAKSQPAQAKKAAAKSAAPAKSAAKKAAPKKAPKKVNGKK